MTDCKVSHFETVWDDVGHREILCLAILARLISVMDQISVAYTVFQNGSILFLLLTLRNADRFSKHFHGKTLQ